MATDNSKPNNKQNNDEVTPANLVNTEHHDSQQDSRNHRVEELCKEAEHHIIGAAETFGEDEKLIQEAKALVPDIQGRIRRIAQSAKTEDALDRDADEAIKAAERYIVNKGRSAKKKREKEEEKKKQEEEAKHGGKASGKKEDKEKQVKERLEDLRKEVEHASSGEQQKMAEGTITSSQRTDEIRTETAAKKTAAGINDAPPVDPKDAARLEEIRDDVKSASAEELEAMLKKKTPTTSAEETAKEIRDKYNQELLNRGIIPEEIHAEITKAVEHEQQKAQAEKTTQEKSQLSPEERKAAGIRISRGGRTARHAVEAAAVAAVVAHEEAKEEAKQAPPNPAKKPLPPTARSRRLMGSGPAAKRPRINIGPQVRRRTIQSGAIGAAAIAALENAEDEYVEVNEEHNDRGRYIIQRDRRDPGTFHDTESAIYESERHPIQRGGLGVKEPPPPRDIERGGFGQALADKEKKRLAKMAEHSVERRAAWAILRSPTFWGVMFWIFVIYVAIQVLLALFGKHESDKKNTACTAPVETMTQEIIGPKETTSGPQLRYDIKIKDTVPNQEVTTVVTIPTGMTFVQSDWTKFTQAGNVFTFKATENLPPNSLSPPDFTIPIYIKTNKPNSVEIIKAVTTPTRAGGAAGGTIIVLDPGHGQESNTTDPATGLIDRESGNTPEREDVFAVANAVRIQLEQKGYTVLLTKASADQSMTHRLRADFANSKGAALAVSIHNDHGQPFSWAEIYTQKVGLYRESNGKRVEFKDAALAAKSLEYANKIAAARAVTEGRPVPLRDANFDARVGYASGNIPLVMLFGTVPWVYNEIGAAPVGVPVPQDQIDKYAQGIANGIEQAIPVTGAAGGNGCGPAGAGGPLPGEVRDVPFNEDTCGGKYRLTSPFKNFGDPLCDYSEDKMNQLYQKFDPADAYKWDALDDCESGNNPNAFNPNSTSGEGGFGSTQLNPEGKGKNEFDAGNVIWDQQAYNSVQLKKINGGWNYWACAIK